VLDNSQTEDQATMDALFRLSTPGNWPRIYHRRNL
jgi:hypothetical protein